MAKSDEVRGEKLLSLSSDALAFGGREERVDRLSLFVSRDYKPGETVIIYRPAYRYADEPEAQPLAVGHMVQCPCCDRVRTIVEVRPGVMRLSNGFDHPLLYYDTLVRMSLNTFKSPVEPSQPTPGQFQEFIRGLGQTAVSNTAQVTRDEPEPLKPERPTIIDLWRGEDTP